jgi:hypothetical protein
MLNRFANSGPLLRFQDLRYLARSGSLTQPHTAEAQVNKDGEPIVNHFALVSGNWYRVGSQIHDCKFIFEMVGNRHRSVSAALPQRP